MNLTRFGNCLCPRAERERDLINQSGARYNSRGNTPLYIGMESKKKRKPKTLNMDQKHNQNYTRIIPKSKMLSTTQRACPKSNSDKCCSLKNNFDSVSSFAVDNMVLAQRPSTLVLMMINSCSYVY